MNKRKRWLGGVALVVAAVVPLSVNASELLTNGGFETGDFTGWTVTALGGADGCQTDWNVSPVGGRDATGCTGSGDGFGFASPGSPSEGAFAAYNSFDGPGPLTYSLRQVVSLPVGLTAATLSWLDTVSWEMPILPDITPPLPREFAVNVYDATGVTLLGNLYTFSIGDPERGEVDWTAHSIGVLPLLGGLGGLSITLAFENVVPEFFTGPAGFGLDGVSLNVEAGVPIPATLALFVLGLTGVRWSRMRLAN